MKKDPGTKHPVNQRCHNKVEIAGVPFLTHGILRKKIERNYIADMKDIINLA